MIAITYTSGYTGLEFIAPAKNIDLTETVVNQYLVGSAITNTAITNAVRIMLISILSNSNIIPSARTKLAEYSGFSLNISVPPGFIEFNSSNVSLDKLTFYVIFRLPYTHDILAYDDVANGEVSESIPENGTGWGKFANYIRTLTGSGIRKINSAGEQVNDNGNPVDENDNIVDGWYQEEAYTYLGENPFSGSYTIPSGLYQSATERAMLFGQNNEQLNAPGEQSLEITKIPLYFYLLAKIENPYTHLNWLNPNKNNLLISRIPHWPSSVELKKYRKHFVKKTIESNISIQDGIYTLFHDSAGTYFNVTETNQQNNYVSTTKIYVQIIDAESISFEKLDLINANKIEINSNGILAIWENHLEYPQLVNNSGLTIGMGVDIGASLNGVYKINIDILISGEGTFRLYSGGRKSPVISTNVSCPELKTVLASLLNISSAKIRVENASGQQSGSPAKILITRQNDDNDIAYNHRIYPYDLESTASIELSPNSEFLRWNEIDAEIRDSWFYYNKLLNVSFSNNPNDPNYWLDQLNISSMEQEALKIYLKRSFGCRSKSGYHIWDENKEMLKKIELKSYVRNLRATYHEFFIPRYYNLLRVLEDGSTRFNGTNGNYSVQYLLNDSRLLTKPNQAEFFAIILLNYNYPVRYVARQAELISAINEHSISKLRHALRGSWIGRIEALDNFMGPSVKLKLYHGIDD